MQEYIHYTSIVGEIVKLYALNEVGASCGDEHCCGIQMACNILINTFAEYNPEIKRLYDENRDKYVCDMIGEEP